MSAGAVTLQARALCHARRAGWRRWRMVLEDVSLTLRRGEMLARGTLRADIPIGIVTQLLGIPLFVLVLARARQGWRG